MGLSQKREIWIVNRPSFGKGNWHTGAADVCHSEHAGNRDRRWSNTSSVVDNIPHCAERERTKAVVGRLELSLKFYRVDFARQT